MLYQGDDNVYNSKATQAKVIIPLILMSTLLYLDVLNFGFS